MDEWASSEFVGRVHELRDLTRYLEEAVAGKGRLVVVSGEGGIGKTRLCEELASTADGLGAGVAWGACWESGGLPPFWPWWQLLGQLGAQVEAEPSGDSPPEAARAHLFASVVDAVRAATLVRPRLLVLDDLQWADTGTLRLLAAIEPVLRTTGALLVATIRETEAAPPPVESGLLRNARSVRLGGLQADELGELVERLTGSLPAPEVSIGLHRLTAGNPLFAAELVRRLHRAGRLDQLGRAGDVPVPPNVRAVLDEQLADLTARCRGVLMIAAIIGREFGLGLLAEVAKCEPLDVLAYIDEAVAGGVVTALDGDQYAFAHPLLRNVMHDDIGVAERVRLHERIGQALEAEAARGGDVDLAALSFHYLSAAPGGVAGKAVHYAERAARSAMADLGYEDAVHLYERALAVTEFDPAGSDRGALLLGLGVARAASGENEGARAAFVAAANQARRIDRPALLATAALGLAGVGFEVGLLDDQQIALLEEALGCLGEGEPGLRSRVSARLSVALSLTGQEERRAELADSAITLAGETADSAALAQALAARCDAYAGPAHVAQRASDSDEIVRIAHAGGDHGTELLGRRLRLVAALEVGDVGGVDAEVYAFAQLAGRLRQPTYEWYVPLWRAMRAAMRGRLTDQNALSAEAERLGRDAGSANSEMLVTAQRWFAWLEAGDVETALSHLDMLLPPGSYPEIGVQTVPILAMHRLMGGRTDEARAMLDRAADDIVAADRDSEWLTVLAQVADVMFRLGGHELAPWIYDQLGPFADLWVVDGIGAYAHGPAHRYLGLLAALLRRPDRAAGHFEAALVANRRAGADLLVARTLFDRGVALYEPETLRAALAAYRDLGVERRAEQVEALLPAHPIAGSDAGRAADGNEFRRAGDTWTVIFDGHVCSVRDSKGMRDIARLLSQPGHEVPVLDLATEGEPALVQGHVGDIVDATARAAYKARLVELEAALDDADAIADSEQSARAQLEREALLEQLSSAYGLAGRPRRTGDTVERARTAVTARIRDAIRRVETLHPELGRHLARSVRTGTFCSYDPDPPTSWKL